MIRSSLVIFFLFFYNLAAISLENYEPPQRSFYFSSAYFERAFNSNKGLMAFPLSAIEGYGALFDITTASFNKLLWSRAIISITEIPFSYWFANSVFVAFHEFGHARAYKAFGLNYIYGTQAFGRQISGIPNYWFLSLARFFTPPFFFPGTGMAFARPSGYVKTPAALKNYWGEEGANIIATAGGLNNQSLLAKAIAQGIYNGHGHITQLGHYLGNKIAGYFYSLMDKKASGLLSAGSSDIGAILKKYAINSNSISHRDIEFQSLFSLLSGATYSFAKGYYNYISHNDARVYTAELFGVRIPDLNSYINARGLSFEIVSGYHYNKNLFFDLAYEFIWKGDSEYQFTPSVHYNIAALAPQVHELWVDCDVVIGKGLGGSLGVHWNPFPVTNTNLWQRFSYFADLSLYNAFNLYGERNIPSMKQGKTMDVSGYIGLALNY